MTAPNTVLKAVRESMRMSQDEFARAIREAGANIGVPNDAGKRLVQRWEAGGTVAPRPIYRRALESVTGLPVESLGFAMEAGDRVHENGTGGHDLAAPEPRANAYTSTTPTGQPGPRGTYSGIWLSRYEYYSSGRDGTYTGLHYVVVLQHGNRLSVRSISGSSDSPLTMDLTVDGNVVTGTWVEQTATDGYYKGARYHGAIQMLAEPTGRRLRGKWVGFGAEMDVNTGPWELVFQDPSTAKAVTEEYSHRPIDQ